MYQTNAELIELQRDLMPQFEEGRVGLSILPWRQSDSNRIIFRQPDIFRGMQQWRGLGQSNKMAGGRYNYFGKYCEIHPGYWGESEQINERFITEMGQPGACGQPIDLTEYMEELQRYLMERRYNRMEFLAWQALVYGRYEALDSDGQVMMVQTYNIRQVSAAIPWSNTGASTPLADFRCIKLFSRGTSADFGLSARAYMNQTTFNCLAANQNPNDVGKAGLSACCTFMGLDIVNQQFAAQGLPQIEIYDGGYVDDDGNFHTFVPDGYVVIVGTRPGNVPVGHYYLTRNAVGCSISSGFWQKIVDNCDRAVPRRIDLHDGHNGGPALEYPRAVVVLKTGCVNSCAI